MFLQRLRHSREVQSMLSCIPTLSSSSSSTPYFRALSTATCTKTIKHDDHHYACNTLIIGGGPMGSSTAYHLAKQRNCRHGNGDGGRGIVVVEKDPTYSQKASCSAMLSAGGIRQQYSLLENVQMALYGVDFLRNANDLLRVVVETPSVNDENNNNNDNDDNVDVQFREHGYLFLASTDVGKQQMLANHQVQRQAGCTNHVLLDQHQLETTFPWINASDIYLASYGTQGEGWFDPWAFIHGLKRKSIAMGVQYIHGIPKRAKRNAETGKVVSIDIELLSKKKNHSSSSTNSGGNNDNNESSSILTTYTVDNVVNAAGARSEDVMTMLAGTARPLKFPLPVKPRKRSIFFFHCSAKDGIPPVAPLTVDPSGVYFRSEGSGGGDCATFLCGVSPTKESDPDIYDDRALDCADYDLFESIIWPALYNRVPAFGEIKVKSSWAGLYEYNIIDQNAIIDFHPEMPNVLMLNGFSGHGLQMSPAAGRAGAELLEHGRFQTLDLGIFSFDRCMGLAPPVLELGIV